MTGFLIVAAGFFLFGVLTAWALCVAAADSDRTYEQIRRDLHRPGPIYWDDPDRPVNGCVHCRTPWPCQKTRTR